MSDTLVHYMPSERSQNVRCLNGNAHANKTHEKSLVTCPLCLNDKTHSGFWAEHNNPRDLNPLFGNNKNK